MNLQEWCYKGLKVSEYYVDKGLVFFKSETHLFSKKNCSCYRADYRANYFNKFHLPSTFRVAINYSREQSILITRCIQEFLGFFAKGFENA
ncbi:hypothetical protein TW73_08960 [Pseudoalteromonas piscicida]|nr:hypothetical protein TW73_08960 [Pseudoalteromonas piscicida]